MAEPQLFRLIPGQARFVMLANMSLPFGAIVPFSANQLACCFASGLIVRAYRQPIPWLRGS
jgi:hypothetical protein